MTTTYIRTSPMPTCNKCGCSMDYWDLRNDETTYRHDDCNNIPGTLSYVPPQQIKALGGFVKPTTNKMNKGPNRNQDAGESIAAGSHTEEVAKPTPPTFGQKAVGISFNPSNDSKVDRIKQIFANAIDEIHALRGDESTSIEVKRMASIAITEAQTAQMWAVKAATWKD